MISKNIYLSFFYSHYGNNIYKFFIFNTLKFSETFYHLSLNLFIYLQFSNNIFFTMFVIGRYNKIISKTGHFKNIYYFIFM